MTQQRLIGLVAVLFTLTACGGHSLRSDETETFSTRILDNGSKLFTYQLDTPSDSAAQPTLVFDANENIDPNTAPDMAPYSAVDEKARIEARVLALMEDKLEASGYCREGYVVSERTIGFRRSVVSGECRETATDDDRSRFAL